ncbi:MAG: tetratricopeptide repeat protein [Bryobacteraceae bacterium]|nr:tetratricopeptide repeat protein [Bryobacteraceae bacterium]
MWLFVAQDAQAAFNRGDYAAAIGLFEAANRRQPACTNSLYAGLAHYRLKQTSQALIAFRTAVACDPQLLAAHLAMAEAYAARGNDGEALAAYLRVLAIDGQHAVALRAAATLYLKTGQHREAQPLLEKLAPQADVLADLGAVYASNGDRPAAEEHFRRALTMDATYFPALTGLGNLLARAGEHEAALPLLRQAVRLRPRAFEAHYLLGALLNRLNQFTEARLELERAVQFGGAREPQIHYQLARAWGGLNRPAERKLALAAFSRLTQQEKENASAGRRAAQLIDEARQLLQAGDLAAAALKLEQARELLPGDSTLLFRLAGLHFDLERLDTAREYVQAAISITPTTWLYHYLLGLVEKSANRLPEAQASLELATRLSGAEAPVFNALGEVRLLQGARAAAQQAFEKACALAPNEESYRQNLAKAQAK